MSFKKQRLIIALVFLSFPLVTALAIAQSRHLSELLFNFALKIVNIRTGLYINAKSWDFSPLEFSAALNEVEVHSPTLEVSTQKMEIKISPLMLLSGKIHLRELLVEESSVKGSFKLEATPKSGEKSEDLVKLISETLQEFSQRLEKRNLSFEKLRLKDIEIDINELQAQSESLLLVNLGSHQFRLDAALKELSLKNKIAPMRDCSFSLVTIRESEKDFFIALRRFDAILDNKETASINASGRIPGFIDVNINSKLQLLENWLKRGSLTKNNFPDIKMSGLFDWNGRLELEENGLESFKGSWELDQFIVSEHSLGKITGNIAGSPTHFQLSDIKIYLPRSPFEKHNLKNFINIDNLLYRDKKVSGVARLNQSGLCAILWASNISECYLNLALSGDIPFEGQVAPLELKINPSLQSEAFRVYASPLQFKTPASEEIVFVKPTSISALATLRSKFVEITETEVRWDNKNAITASGKIDYVPTEVNLDVNSKQIDFQSVIYDLLSVPIEGPVNIHSSIFYSTTIPRSRGRTRVISKFSGNNFYVLGQNLGFISSDVSYINNTLQIGPTKVYSGEGQALLFAKLSQKNKKSWLEVDALFDKYEVNIASKDPTQLPYFQAPLDGKGSISGYIDTKNPEAFIGDLKLKVDNINSFGISFESADLDATVSLEEFKINQLKAQKENAEVILKGRFNKEISEISFHSTPVPIRNLGYLPEVESSFNKGSAIFKGFWNSQDRWAISGDIKSAEYLEQPINEAKLEVSGVKDELDIRFKTKESLDIQYKNKDGKIDIKTKAKDSGIKLLFSLVNKSKITSSLQSEGYLEFEDSKDSGIFRMENIKISDRANDTDILWVDGKHRVEWEKNSFIEGAKIEILGPNTSSLEITPDKNRFLIGGNLDNSLVDLFLPEILVLQNGTTKLSGQIKLPLNLFNIDLKGNLLDSTLLVPALGKPIQNIKAPFKLEKGKFILPQSIAKLSPGNVSFSGSYDFATEGNPVNLSAILDQSGLVINENIPVTANGNVTLRGRSRPYNLSGKLAVVGGNYSVEYNESSQISSNSSEDANINFNLQINIVPGFKILNSLMNGEIDGRMRLLGNDLSPKFVGKIGLNSGKIFAKDNEFQIDRGYLLLNNSESQDVFINLEAQSVKNYNDIDYTIQMLATGPVETMNLKFSSEPTLTTNEIVSLLTFGYIPQEDNNNTQGSYLAQNAGIEAFQILFGKAIGSSINKKTGFDVKVGTQSDLQQKESIPKVTVVRRLSKKATATFGRSLDLSRPENNFKIDYKLLKNMNLTGVWENPEEKKHSLGADIRFKFDIK